MNILQSENFKKDQARIQKFLSETQNEQIKKQISDLSKELVYTVRKLDQMHGDISNIGKLSDGSQELRSKILEIRKQIDKIIPKF